MDTQTPLSNATWREIDRDVGRLPDTQVRRLRWLVPLFLLGVAVLGTSGLIKVNLQPPPRPKPIPVPVFPATDGLPDVLIEGEKYRTSFQVRFPTSWPRETTYDRAGMTGAIVTVTARGKGDNQPPGSPEAAEVIFCSNGADYAAGQSITLDCIIPAPSPGPFTVHLYAEPRGSWLIFDQGNQFTRNYQHTVRSPEHP